MSHVMWKPVYAIWEQQRRRLQSDQHLGQFECYLVKNPEDRFSRDEAPMYMMWKQECFIGFEEMF